MKVNNIDKLLNIQDKSRLEKETPKEEKKQAAEKSVVYQKSKKNNKAHVYDKTMVDKLKMESEKTRDGLRNMVRDLLRRQGKAVELLDPNANIEIDETTRTQAQAMISDDGPLGVEPMSDKIVDFAKAISGGDKGKLEELKGAIEKGFNEAKRILGGTLPEISQKTYESVMDKLSAWENE